MQTVMGMPPFGMQLEYQMPRRKTVIQELVRDEQGRIVQIIEREVYS
jgi:hypothetical protein